MPFDLRHAFRPTLQRLFREQRGAVAVLTGLSLTVLLGFAGLAIDVSHWETTEQKMQAAADDAAYSAAMTAHNGGGSPADTAKGVAASMGFVNGAADGTTVVVNNPPTQGRYTGNHAAWEVIITQPQQKAFASLFLSSSPVAKARAVAHAQGSSVPYCILALHPSASQSVSVQGGAHVHLSGCSIQVNSTSNTALHIWGNSQLIADTASVTGYYTVGSSSTLTTTEAIDAPGAQPAPDPYANVQIPSYSGCGGGNHQVINSTTTLNPGVYCNGLKFNGTAVVTLNPGIYIIDRGSLSIMGGAVVNTNTSSTPYGVTFILTSSTGSNYATVTVDGGSTVNLTAPTEGPTAGLVFYQDRRDTSTASLTGGAGQSYTGALYFPSAILSYNGDSGNSACTQIIANMIVYSGSSTVNSSCGNTGITEITSYATALAE